MLEGQKKNLYKLNFYKSCKSSRPPNKSINNLLAWEEMLKICCSSHVLQTDTKICDTIKKKKQFPILFFTCYKFKKEEVGQNSKWWAIQEFLNDFAKVLLLLLLDNSRMLVSNWTCQQLFVHHSQNTEKLTFFKIVSMQVIIRLSITNMLYWFDV